MEREGERKRGVIEKEGEREDRSEEKRKGEEKREGGKKGEQEERGRSMMEESIFAHPCPVLSLLPRGNFGGRQGVIYPCPVSLNAPEPGDRLCRRWMKAQTAFACHERDSHACRGQTHTGMNPVCMH